MTIRIFLVFCLTLIPFMIFGLPKFTIDSKSFENNRYIPSKYSYHNSNISPELHWKNFPKKTKSFAIIVDDPDAPVKTWIHWVIYNIPLNITSLKEHLRHEKVFPNGITQGKSDFNNFGYDGPAPPYGTHHYHFKIYALNAELNLKPGLTKKELIEKIENHILAQTEIIGLFSK